MTRHDHATIPTPARTAATAVAAALFSTLLLTACTGEAGPGAEQATDTAAMDTVQAMDTMAADTMARDVVEVGLTEFQIDMPETLPPGRTTFRVTNDGAVEHNFEVEGQGMEEVLQQNLAPGDSATLEVDLQPGTYEIYCPVGNHADQGMRMELTVEEGAGGAGS